MNLASVPAEKPRPVIKVLLLGSTEQRRADARTELESIADPKLTVTGLPLPATPRNGDEPYSAAAGEPDVVMLLMSENENEEDGLSYLQTVARRATRPSLFAILVEHSPDLMRRAMRAGADELLFLPLVPSDVTRALIKVAETKRRSENREGGIVCSITSLMGGSGVTSMSVNLALAMCRELGRTVALVDLDLQAGMLSIQLNLRPENTIAALVRPELALDSIQLRATLTRHSSGVFVLAAPKQVEEAELVSAETVTSIIKLMRQMFDVVIVDCGHSITEQSLAAWEQSDHLLYILDQSIGGARCAWRFIHLFERLKMAGVHAHFVLGRYVSNYPITPEQIVQTLARPIYGVICSDDKAMDRVQLSGEDLWQVAPKSPLTRSVVALARKLANVTDNGVAEKPRGLVTRLFPSLAHHA
jgi:pilus assembly protein CpaE